MGNPDDYIAVPAELVGALNLISDALMVGRVIAHALNMAGCHSLGMREENGGYVIDIRSPAGIEFELTLKAR